RLTPVLIAYVSDENFSALHDVSVVLEREGTLTAARSLANGAVVADVPPGEYAVTLARDGYGPKRVTLALPAERPCQWRLLSDRLLGYVWPKWTAAGGEG